MDCDLPSSRMPLAIGVKTIKYKYTQADSCPVQSRAERNNSWPFIDNIFRKEHTPYSQVPLPPYIPFLPTSPDGTPARVQTLWEYSGNVCRASP